METFISSSIVQKELVLFIFQKRGLNILIIVFGEKRLINIAPMRFDRKIFRSINKIKDAFVMIVILNLFSLAIHYIRKITITTQV
jgi:hypothetical protein